MLLGQLTALLSLLGGAQLLTGSGRPPPQPPATSNHTWAQGLGAAASPGPSSALGSWKAFLGLQKAGRLGPRARQPGQQVATALSLPLDPQEVAREMCRAVPFTQVLSRPGCIAVRLRNHLCFGHCSSVYVPGSGPTPRVLCNSCVPAHRRRVPVALWCSAGRPASQRRVMTSTVLVKGCQCSPRV
ncbi:DAN domain family member 5 [Equus przewalskii]|uniref:DAN domain family member 5 n=1 Tax=Equus przewalskii TaxID=9798 RepID=A0ABM4PZU2_EQUPR